MLVQCGIGGCGVMSGKEQSGKEIKVAKQQKSPPAAEGLEPQLTQNDAIEAAHKVKVLPRPQLNPKELLALQRMVGNRAVQRLITRKKVPDHSYSKETAKIDVVRDSTSEHAKEAQTAASHRSVERQQIYPAEEALKGPHKPGLGALAGLSLSDLPGAQPAVQFKKTLRERVAELERRTEWNKRRQDSILELNLFEGRLRAAKSDWRIAMGELGDAYHLAYKDHKDSLIKQQKWEKLQIDLACGVLTMVAGGALGGLGEALHKMEGVPKFLHRFTTKSAAGRLEDMIQIGVGEGIDIIQGQYVPRSGNPVSKDPELFRSSLVRSLDGQWLKSLEFFNRVRAKLRDADTKSFKDISVDRLKAQMNKFAKKSKFMKRPTHHPVAKMRKEQERGMWSQWLPRNLTTQEWTSYKGMKYKTSAYHEPGKYVMIAMDRLHISRHAGIPKSGWWRFFMSERNPLLRWAKSPQPPIKKFKF